MGNKYAHEARSDDLQMVPSADFVTAGFVCTSWSYLNKDAKENLSTISEKLEQRPAAGSASSSGAGPVQEPSAGSSGAGPVQEPSAGKRKRDQQPEEDERPAKRPVAQPSEDLEAAETDCGGSDVEKISDIEDEDGDLDTLTTY